MTPLLVCVFGGFGAVARFILDTSIQRWWNRPFPLSTLIINIVGGFCVGVAAAAYFNQTVDQQTYLLFVVGFFGGFSTFSITINQIVSMARNERRWGALVYLVVTIIISLLSIAFGWWLGSLGSAA